MEAIALDAAEPLTQAAFAGNTTQVTALLQSGINVDSRCADGRTSLILAAMLGHEATVKVLLANGADVTLRGRDDRTALQCARRNRHFGIETLLKHAGATQ
ncbi:MAG: ankyrin repeat domain-containing protein [Actinomycetota bacterium]